MSDECDGTIMSSHDLVTGLLIIGFCLSDCNSRSKDLNTVENAIFKLWIVVSEKKLPINLGNVF